MYVFIRLLFIPSKSQGKDSVRNSISIATASRIISFTRSSEGLLTMCLYIRHAKSQCKPSSLLINSFEKVTPGRRFLKREASNCIGKSCTTDCSVFNKTHKHKTHKNKSFKTETM